MLVQVRVEADPEFSKASCILYHLTKVFLWKNLAFETLHFMDYEKILFVSFTPPQIFFNFFNQNAYEDIILILAPQHPEKKYCCRDKKRYFLFY